MAVNFVYPDFSDPVTEKYKQKTIPVLKKQLSLGGMRLSQLMVDIYDSATPIPPSHNPSKYSINGTALFITIATSILLIIACILLSKRNVATDKRKLKSLGIISKQSNT